LQCYKVFGQKFSLYLEGSKYNLKGENLQNVKNCIARTRRVKIIVLGNILKRLCTLNQISFETKQKSKYKVYFNFIFISIEFFLHYPNFFGGNPGTTQNFIAHVL